MNRIGVTRPGTAYDPLDRPTTQAESHLAGGVNPAAAPQRTTAFTHLGLSNGIVQEVLAGVSRSAGTKDYRYDAFGTRTTFSFTPGTGATETASRSAYGYDLHGNVSLLWQDAAGTQAARASYGYEAYAKEAVDPRRWNDTADHDGNDSGRTNGGAVYQDVLRGDIHRQQDAGHGGRRFSPSVGRFLQQDAYRGAFRNLRLALDPLTQNRYSLAGGNTISFVEVEGHDPLDENWRRSFRQSYGRDPEWGTNCWNSTPWPSVERLTGVRWAAEGTCTDG